MSNHENYAKVFEYPKLQEYIRDHQTSEKEVKALVDEIGSDYSPAFVEKLKVFMDATFAKLYQAINIQYPPDMDVPELAKKYSLILVPNHQSHADYLGIGYAFYKEFGFAVHVAAGINLNFFPIGSVFRRGGAFFIRRTMKDNPLYKLVLEAYICGLLKDQKVIKFYFEGGRSRTGKLLSPRFGLFHMLLEAFSHIENAKPLCFLPVSISHEYLPDSSAHKREMMGAKKQRESSTKLLKLYKILGAKLGSIHLKIGKPIIVDHVEKDEKKQVQNLAFECFRAVGRGMMVSPTSLLAMILLDPTVGAQTEEVVLYRAQQILNYCRMFDIPLTTSLETESEKTLKDSLSLLIENHKVQIHKHPSLGTEIYFVADENRLELLYLKNTILHHFLVPLFISSAWINIFRGSIHTTKQLMVFFLEQRNLLKFEFYLPETEAMFESIKEVITKIMGREHFSFEESFSLESKDFYHLGATVSLFTSSFSYIYEGYYITALTLKFLEEKSFRQEELIESAKAIFETEKNFGRLIRFPESFSVPLLKSSMAYFENEGVLLKTEEGKYWLQNTKTLDQMLESFVQRLTDSLSLNLKTLEPKKN